MLLFTFGNRAVALANANRVDRIYAKVCNYVQSYGFVLAAGVATIGFMLVVKDKFPWSVMGWVLFVLTALWVAGLIIRAQERVVFVPKAVYREWLNTLNQEVFNDPNILHGFMLFEARKILDTRHRLLAQLVLAEPNRDSHMSISPTITDHMRSIMQLDAQAFWAEAQ